MSARTRVAVIGVGAMGVRHAETYRRLPDSELLAVVDVDKFRTAAVAKRLGVRAYADHREMIERERPDAVTVSVPTSEHFRVARDALAGGCHVLVEKPLATSLVEAQTLVATADAARRVLRVGHIERFNPAVIELRGRLLAGEAGRLIGLHARRLGPYPARVRDVGVALDLATHDLDVMRWLVGSEATIVTAVAKRSSSGSDEPSHEDWLSGVIRFADDTVGRVEASWRADVPIRELVVTGSDGSFLLDYVAQSLHRSRGSMDRDIAEVAVARGVPLEAELAEFLHATRGEPSADGVRGADGADGLASVYLALALLAAAETDRSRSIGVQLVT